MDATTDAKPHGHQHATHGRVEDEPLVRGRGRYAADDPLPNQAYGVFVRSPHAFARIKSIDIAAAAGTPGVVGVLTGADMTGVGNIARHPPLPGKNGAKLIVANRPALAQDRVMHIGEPVALVIAERALAAQDAAEFVTVDYEDLTPVIDAREALKPGAPQLWPEAPGNLAVEWAGPAADPAANAAEVERIFASAAHVARFAEMNQRLCVATDGAARRHRKLRCGARRLFAALLLAKRRRDARQHYRHHELAEGEAARHHRGRRRRFRPEDLGLSRISRAAGRPRKNSAGRCIGCPAARKRF